MTNDNVLQKDSREIDAELRRETLTEGVGLRTLLKRRGIYDGSIQDLWSGRLQRWWDTFSPVAEQRRAPPPR